MTTTQCVESLKMFLGPSFNPKGCELVLLIGDGFELNNEEALRSWVMRCLFDKNIFNKTGFDVRDLFTSLRDEIYEKLCCEY